LIFTIELIKSSLFETIGRTNEEKDPPKKFWFKALELGATLEMLILYRGAFLHFVVCLFNEDLFDFITSSFFTLLLLNAYILSYHIRFWISSIITNLLFITHTRCVVFKYSFFEHAPFVVISRTVY
jgi:hypothetical protein